MAKKTKNFAAKADFTVEMLPRNRKTQFFTIVRDRIPLLLKLSLVTLLFFIPTILATSYKTVVVYNFYKRFNAGEIDESVLNGYVFYTKFIFSLIYVPCFLIAAAGVSGLNRITHRLVFGEGILFKEDYLLGIKNNYKQYATFTLCYSCIYALIWFGLFRTGGNIVMTVVSFVTALIVFPYMLISFTYGNVYTSTGAELISNVLRAEIKSKFTIVWVSLVVILPVITICLFCSGYLFLFTSMIYVFLLPIYSLMLNSAFADVFDQSFNLLNHEEIVKKGLYVSDKEKEIIHQSHQRLRKEFEEKGE